MLRTILLATDGSEYAEKATELAADLAKVYKSRLILLNVRQPNGTPNLAGGPMIAAPVATFGADQAVEQDDLDATGEGVLNGAQEIAREFGAEKIETVTVEGDPVTQVLRCAEFEKVDLIVMGSRGLSQLKSVLLGSVSDKVTRLAPCPTLTVK